MVKPRRRRPRAIAWFAVLFLCSALSTFLLGMHDLDAAVAEVTMRLPGVPSTRDAAIVFLSARLSIALIPTLLVWFRASNFARWMVTLLALGRLVAVPDAWRVIADGQPISPLWLAGMVLAFAAVPFLFTPASRRYFSRQPEPDLAVFD